MRCVRRLAYEADPDAFADSCKAEQNALTDKLEAARQLLKKVKISEELQVGRRDGEWVQQEAREIRLPFK